MSRTMYDSTNPFDIPRGVEMVAGYVNGIYAWPDAGWQYHSASAQVRISISGDYSYANVLDVETGDATPQDAVSFIRAKMARGEWPTLYYSLSRHDEVSAVLHAAGIGGWGVWIALWDGRPELEGWYVAKQYSNPDLTNHHYDLSIVQDYWPGVDALPAPVAAGGAAGTIQGWSGLATKVDFDLPAFASELGVIASGLTSLG